MCVCFLVYECVGVFLCLRVSVFMFVCECTFMHVFIFVCECVFVFMLCSVREETLWHEAGVIVFFQDFVSKGKCRYPYLPPYVLPPHNVK